MSPATPSGFDATLRFEVASDEGRALLTSYLVATILALAWLALVHVVPRPLVRAPAHPEDPTIVIVIPPELAAPPIESRASHGGEGIGPTSPRTGSRDAGSGRSLFGGRTALVDAGKLLRGVDVTGTGATAHEPTALKVGLNTGVGSRTPGRTRTGGLSPVGSGVGAVSGGGVSRNAVAIAAPEVRAVADGAPRGDVSEVGQTARAHVPQLERCYHEEGLTRNASLAGLVRLAIDVEAGRVTTARIVDRSWAGAGAAETESCLLRSVRGWRLGSSSARIVLPLSFTSPTRR
jgi:hypothetical protein